LTFLLFFTVLLYRTSTNEIKAIHFCVISDVPEHNSYFVRKALEKITVHQKWTNLNVHTVHIWSDGGPHDFRTYEAAVIQEFLFFI